MQHGLSRGITSRGLLYGSVVVAVAVLTGCAATQTAIEHGKLETSSKLSETVFLNPVPDSQKTVFVSVKNTSDHEMNVESALKSAIKARGYQVMSDPRSAHYLLQANVLKVGKMSMAASKSALGGGFGSALAGGAAGSALGSLAHTPNAMIGGAIAGGLIGLAADSLVKDVNYTMVTDVQISERVAGGVKVREEHRTAMRQGSASSLNQTAVTDSQYQRYRLRVVSNADKVNLAFKDAVPALKSGLVNVLVGIF